LLRPLPARHRICADAFCYYPRLARVRRFVETHYQEDLPLAKAARVAALERKYFSAFFHHKVGIPYTDWISRVRIEKAIELIRTRDCPLAQVAVEVGFHEPRTFQRKFKRWTGLTPSEFKQLIRPRAAAVP